MTTDTPELAERAGMSAPAGRRYDLVLIDDRDGDPDDRIVETVALLQRQGYQVEPPPRLVARLRRQARDDLLRAAHALMPASSPWGRCVQLAAEIRRFEERVWPRLADHETLPERRYQMLTTYLFRARRLGELPRSARMLRYIAAKCGPPWRFHAWRG